MQHDITGITCGAGTVSWTAHRPPGSFSNSSFYTFLSSAIGQSHSLLASALWSLHAASDPSLWISS